jgi:hypothetical protein
VAEGKLKWLVSERVNDLQKYKVVSGKIAQIEHQMMLQHNTHHLISSLRRMKLRDHIGLALKKKKG